ncbi:hypothetical protein TruAng_011712 [Truncatella angustata]|nr:hypothetical protein TruAng_011712 [Truncatella angustata]
METIKHARLRGYQVYATLPIYPGPAILRGAMVHCYFDGRIDYLKRNILQVALELGMADDAYDFLAAHTDLAKDLLDHQDYFGRTALHLAAVDNTRVVLQLLERGASCHLTDTNGKTPLHYAMQKGSKDIVQALLSAYGTSKEASYHDCSDGDECTPLVYAAKLGHTEAVKLLLTHGSRLITSDKECGQNALHWASLNGHHLTARALLAASCELLNTSNRLGQTPLHLACLHERAHVVTVLLQNHSIERDKADLRGESPLTYSAKKGHISVMKLLLDTRAVDLDSTDKDGQSPLWWANREGKEEAVQLLLRYGARLDKEDQFGRMLHDIDIEMNVGHTGVVKTLQSYPAVQGTAGTSVPCSSAAQQSPSGVIAQQPSHMYKPNHNSLQVSDGRTFSNPLTKDQSSIGATTQKPSHMYKRNHKSSQVSGGRTFSTPLTKDQSSIGATTRQPSRMYGPNHNSSQVSGGRAFSTALGTNMGPIGAITQQPSHMYNHNYNSSQVHSEYPFTLLPTANQDPNGVMTQQASLMYNFSHDSSQVPGAQSGQPTIQPPLPSPAPQQNK